MEDSGSVLSGKTQLGRLRIAFEDALPLPCSPSPKQQGRRTLSRMPPKRVHESEDALQAVRVRTAVARLLDVSFNTALSPSSQYKRKRKPKPRVAGDSAALYVLQCEEEATNPKISKVTGKFNEPAAYLYVGSTLRSLEERMAEHEKGRSYRTKTGTWRLLGSVSGWTPDAAALDAAENNFKGGGDNVWRHMLLNKEQETVTRDHDCLFVEGGDVAEKVRQRFQLLMEYLRGSQPNLKMMMMVHDRSRAEQNDDDDDDCILL